MLPRGSPSTRLPRTIIAKRPCRTLLGGDAAMARSRRPEDRRRCRPRLLTRASRDTTGNFFIDEAVLVEAGITDFSSYAYTPDADLLTDLFLEG